MGETNELTRLELFKRTGAFGASLALGGTLLAACGGSSTTTGSITAEAVSAAAARKRLATATGTVRALYWEFGYQGQDSLPKGVHVDTLPMTAVEDSVNKKGTYDVASNVSGLFPVLDAAGAMLPMNLDLVPALSESVDYAGLVESNGTPKFATINGTPYGVGLAWATLTGTYLKGAVKPYENLEELLEPEYRGKFGIGDDATSAIMMVSRASGIGGDRPGYLTPDQLDEVFAKLEEFKEAAKGFIANPYAEYPSQYARGEIAAAFPDSPVTATIAQESGTEVQYTLPKGAVGYSESWFLGSGGNATDADYAFINSSLQESAQLKLGRLFGGGVFNAKAMNKLRQEIPFLEDPEKVLSAAPLCEWPPLQSDKYTTYSDWSKRWQELKV